MGEGPVPGAFMKRVLRMIRQNMVIGVTGAEMVAQSNGGYIARLPAFPKGGGGSFEFPWQKPNKELDPTVAVKSGIFVYVSPQNPIATTGLTDSVSGEIIIVTPGIWQAVQTVPAQVTVAGTVKYNVPQPIAQAATSGSPLEGDADAAGLFWIPWSATGNSCF